MKPVVTAEQMRRAEEPLLAAGQGLMRVAAAAVARAVRGVAPEGPVIVAAGPGNNGGDGLFAAALLAAEREVKYWLVTGRGHAAGLEAARAAGAIEVGAVEAMAGLSEAALVIDAVLGIGGRPGLAEPVALLAASCDDLGIPVLSVDLPSGLDANSGEVDVSFRATRTVTFAAPKPCHVLQPAASRCGAVTVADIGVPIAVGDLRVAEPSDVARGWPVPAVCADKYSRGVVGIDAGSATYPGAGVLACAGALNAGAGMVRYLGGAPAELVLARFPSVVPLDGRVQALVLGPGWGQRFDGERILDAAAEREVPLVIDADALALLPKRLGPDPLLTPHAGELARLLGCERSAIERDPIGSARRASARFGATVLLKGATQVVATPGGRATVAVTGPAWTAQAGSGDVLAGICGALLAAGLTAEQAGILGVSLQAMTAAAHPGPRTPDDLASRLGSVIADLVA